MDFTSFPTNIFCCSRSPSRMPGCMLLAFLLRFLWSVMGPFFLIPFRNIMSCICNTVWFIWHRLHSILGSLQYLGWFFKNLHKWNSLFVVYTSIGFIKSIEWCIHRDSTIKTSFITPKIPFCSPLASKPSYFLKPWAANDLFLSLLFYLF